MITLKEGFFVIAIFIIILCIIFMPFLLIWCLNVFGLAIPYTLETWFASLLILALCRGGYHKS